MELGSEFNLDINELSFTEDNLFEYFKNYSYTLYDSCRSAIRHIPIDREKNVLLPEYVCESVINCFDYDKIFFYKITSDLKIDFEDLQRKINNNTGTIFIVHYFGTTHSIDSLLELREVADKRDIKIIEDTTQSLFSIEETIGHYMVASIRKWLSIPMGGMLYVKDKADLPDTTYLATAKDNSRSCAMILKTLYLNNKLECNETYRKIFVECERKLDNNNEIKLISHLSKFIITCIDINDLISKRISNYNYLRDKLVQMGIFPVLDYKEKQCPFVLLLRVRDRDYFREYLIDHQIYCAVHWPMDDTQVDCRKIAEYNSKSLISLPVDQRYGKTELDYLIDIVRCFGRELSC